MKPYSNDLREKIVEAYENKEGSIRKLSKIFKVGTDFVWRLTKRYRETGSVDPKPHGGGNPSTIDAKGIEILSELVFEHRDATLKEYCQFYEKETGTLVSIFAMCRVLQRLGLSRKKKTLRAEQRETVEAINYKTDFMTEIFQIHVNRLVFLDETGVNLSLGRKYARSLVGQRVFGTKSKRGNNTTILGALSLQGIIASMTIEGYADGDVFLAYVEQVLVPKLWPTDVVVMDNLSVHKIEGVEKAIKSVGASVMYLPSYTPELNPIEECWSKVKNFIRSSLTDSQQALEEVIGKALDAITPQNAFGWFYHAGYRN